MTWSASKYTTKPGYSQREIGGLPTAGTLVTGAPNLVATWSMVMPRVGVTTSDSLTAMPLSTAMVSAAARPPASTAASSRYRYFMAHLICCPYYFRSFHGPPNYNTPSVSQSLTQLTL